MRRPRLRRERAPAKIAERAPAAFVTPEGVDLRLTTATFAERAGALILDLLIVIAILIALTILVALVLFGAYRISGGRIQGSGELLLVVWGLGAFLVRNFYFTGFELRARAATPGKRLMRLRVIARDGGRLTADAVFARNAMRELELFLPVSFLVASGSGVDAGLALLGLTWTGALAVFPLFNRDRLRLGDIAAGTRVIKLPDAALRIDLVRESPASVGGVAFTDVQVDAYGIKELHVLEEVLRRGDRRTIAQVAERIRGKIGWDGPSDVADRTFLSAYYTALRGRLEARALFGRRRKDKFDV